MASYTICNQFCSFPSPLAVYTEILLTAVVHTYSPDLSTSTETKLKNKCRYDKF